MPLVVSWATARDFGEMERCLAGGDAAATYEEFETWDLALHRCIMAAAHSPLLAALYGVDRVGPARPGLGRSQAPQHLSPAPRPLPGRPPRGRRGAAGPGSDAAVEAMRRHLAASPSISLAASDRERARR